MIFDQVKMDMRVNYQGQEYRIEKWAWNSSTRVTIQGRTGRFDVAIADLNHVPSVDNSHKNVPILKLLETAEIVMLTFGGKQVWMSKPEDFYGDKIATTNPAFTIVQAGLNYYIFPTAKIEILR